MAELNLIPSDYLKLQNMRKSVWRFLYVLGGLFVLIVAARIGLGAAVNFEKSRAEKLKTGEVLLQEQKMEFQLLEERKEQLQLRLDMLEKLRGGPPAREIFMIIDQAINDAVWFTRLSFSRAGEEDQDSPKGTQTGYFIVVPKEGGAETRQKKELPDSAYIDISGMALSHSALAAFVDELVAQEQIKSVQVKNTRSRKYLETSVIEYELTAVMLTEKAG